MRKPSWIRTHSHKRGSRRTERLNRERASLRARPLPVSMAADLHQRESAPYTYTNGSQHVHGVGGS